MIIRTNSACFQAGGTATDFYKRHSRWTEGLLSAAKAVGWGASTLVNTADDVVSGTGKFEQLEVSAGVGVCV